MSENCPKHGPYSVFCRECDYEQVHGPATNTQPPTQEVRSSLERRQLIAEQVRWFREEIVAAERGKLSTRAVRKRHVTAEAINRIEALFSPPAGVVEALRASVAAMEESVRRLDRFGHTHHELGGALDLARQALSALEGMGADQ